LKILIVIVAYNPTLAIVNNLLIPGYKSLVIDNSVAETPWLRDYCIANNIGYSANKANLGIATALNIGAQYALKQAYDWIITLDQDSKLTINVVHQLIQLVKNYPDSTKLAIVSPKHSMQGLTPESYLANSWADYSETILTMTSGNLVNLAIWQQVGGFKEDLFIDAVDIEYYARVRKHGYKVIELNKVFLQHQLGNMYTKVFLGRTLNIMNHNHVRKYYQIRNSLWLLEGDLLTAAEKAEIRHILVKYNFLGVILYEEDKVKKITFMLLGYFDYLRGVFGKCPWK
jgi:rhamnosyltransferase